MESSRRVLGEDAPLTIQAIKSLGWSYQHRGQGWATINDPTRRPLRTEWSAQAVALLREALERSQRVLGEDDRLTLYTAADLALALGENGDYAEAEELIRENIARSARVLGENDSQTINARMTFAAIMYYSGHVEEAIAMGQEVMADLSQASGDNDVLTVIMELKLGVLQLEEGRIDEAEPLLRDAARRLPLTMGGDDQYSRECAQAIARLERLKDESSRKPDR